MLCEGEGGFKGLVLAGGGGILHLCGSYLMICQISNYTF